jgi:hypothetical protein
MLRRSTNRLSFAVIPAKAGIHFDLDLGLCFERQSRATAMDPSFRWDDGNSSNSSSNSNGSSNSNSSGERAKKRPRPKPGSDVALLIPATDQNVTLQLLM